MSVSRVYADVVTPQIAHFQNALASAADNHQFQGVPVDWWDEHARTWRPTVVESTVADRPSAARHHVDILAPFPTDMSPEKNYYITKRVSIHDVRPSRFLNHAFTRFFVRRYMLDVMYRLLPCITQTSEATQDSVRAVVKPLLNRYESGFTLWATVFQRGIRRARRSQIVPLRTVAQSALPHSQNGWQSSIEDGATDIFSALTRDGHLATACSPVAWWDHAAHTWRPTLLLGATDDNTQLTQGSLAHILIPGEQIQVATVCGDELKPMDIADTQLELFAIPILARDLLRLHEALVSAHFRLQDLVSHPMLVELTRMLQIARREWQQLYDSGMPGDAPSRITPQLDLSAWGLSTQPHVVVHT